MGVLQSTVRLCIREEFYGSATAYGHPGNRNNRQWDGEDRKDGVCMCVCVVVWVGEGGAVGGGGWTFGALCNIE